MLIVWPMKLSTMIEVRIDSGIDTAMMRVERQLPRNSRIISAVRQAAMTASRMTLTTAPLTKIDWSASASIRNCGGKVCSTRGRMARMPLTTLIVEASPALMMLTSTPRRPFWRTILVCGAKAMLTVADVAQIDRRVADGLDRHVVQLLGCPRRAIDVDVIFELGDFCRARRQDQIFLLDRVEHVGRREPLGLELLRIEADKHLALLAAIGIGNDGARHGDELGAQEVHGQIVEFLLRQARTGKPELQDRHAGGAEIENFRRLRARRHLPQHQLRVGGDLGIGGVEAGIRLKVDFDQRLAIVGRRFNMLDIVDEGRQRAFVGRGQPAFHLLRVQAGVGPHHGDDGNIDIGKNIGRRPEDHHRTQNKDQQRQHDERIGPIEREADDPHSMALLSGTAARFSSGRETTQFAKPRSAIGYRANLALPGCNAGWRALTTSSDRFTNPGRSYRVV